MNKRPVSYLQTDKRWADVDYSAPGEATNIKESGCGPTAAAMLISTLTGKEFTPVDACRFSLDHGYKALKQGTYYAYFKPQFAAHGIECKQLNPSNVYGKKNADVHETAFQLLTAGWYLIAVMGPGTWTKGGHFVVPYWINKTTNTIYINDPASTKKERVEGNYDTFKSQVKYYWAIDARSYNKEVEDVSTYTKKLISIPLKDIAKIEIYINKYKKDLSSIMKETGADYGINGGFFEWSWEPCPILKVNGAMKASYPNCETAWGYAWDAGNDIAMLNTWKTKKNFLTGIDLINPWDGAHAKLNYPAEVGGKRGRSAIGIRGDELVLYCTKDGSSYAKKPESLRDELAKFGCDTAMMLDSGGSSQIQFKNGDGVYSTREVYDYILVYLTNAKNSSGASPSTSAKEKDIVKTIQSELNKRYGANLAVDGSWGAASKKAMIKAVQTEINQNYGGKLAVDGSWGAKSKAACPAIKKGAKGDLVWLLQANLCLSGQVTAMDSSFGSATLAAVRAYQKKASLGVDGSAGPNTWTSLLK